MPKKYTIEIDIPNGKEIDFEKSTLTNVVFKDMKPIIKWNDMYWGVEINADGEHFIIDGKSPTAVCNRYAAKRYASEPNYTWKLPTINQLKVIAKYFDEIDNVITDNNGFNLVNGRYWTCENEDEFNTRYVVISNGHNDNGFTGSDNNRVSSYVRSVCPL
jgi:hypothetical protein